MSGSPRAAAVMNPNWRPAYVAVGSNLSAPCERVSEACGHLQSIADTRLEACSRLYRTQPLGPQDQPEFINAAVGLLTRLGPHEMLQALLAIERRMGRIRRERWGPRVIDLDLIWMLGPTVDEPALQLPHPGVSSRNFVLYPLSDIAPSLDLPGHGRVLDLKSRAGAQGISLVGGASRP